MNQSYCPICGSLKTGLIAARDEALAAKDAALAALKAEHEKALADKDARIAELEKEKQQRDNVILRCTEDDRAFRRRIKSFAEIAREAAAKAARIAELEAANELLRLAVEKLQSEPPVPTCTATVAPDNPWPKWAGPISFETRKDWTA